MLGWWRRRRVQRDCWHHARGVNGAAAESWVTGHLIDLGRSKLFECSNCRRIWIA